MIAAVAGAAAYFQELALTDATYTAASALLDAGAINGGTPAEVCETDLNLRKETLKAVVVAAMYHDAREDRK